MNKLTLALVLAFGLVFNTANADEGESATPTQSVETSATEGSTCSTPDSGDDDSSAGGDEDQSDESSTTAESSASDAAPAVAGSDNGGEEAAKKTKPPAPKSCDDLTCSTGSVCRMVGPMPLCLPDVSVPGITK